MIGKIKVAGLLFGVALCAGALAAPAAQAEEGSGVFTSGLTPSTHTATTLWGEQEGTEAENYFRTTGGSEVTCKNEGVKYKAKGNNALGEGTSTEITTEEPVEGQVNKTYQDCTAEGLAATVTMEGCHYKFTRPVKLQENEYTGTVDLVCPANKSIIIHVYLFGTPTGSHSVPVCTIEVKPGNNTKHVITTNKHTEGKHDEVTIKATVNGIETHKSGTCGEANEVAEFRSNITVRGEGPGGEAHDVWISG